jgi:nitroimidazol reductase NimA-like FMN-containing flavoprotein (pyridoxamine 5'-phosphate oxidase superfamily)
MRRKEKEITDIEQIEAVLQKAKICRIGLCDKGTPYVVPVCFGYKAGILYFHCAREGRKIDILRRNNRVCIEAEVDVEFVGRETACNWSLKYKSAVGFGRAHFIEDPQEKSEALSILMAHYSDGQFDFSEEMLKRTAVVKVEIESFTGKQSGYQTFL